MNTKLTRRYLHVNMVADGVHIEGFFSKHEGAKVIAGTERRADDCASTATRHTEARRWRCR